jgi:hypothetical protein
MPRTLEFLQLSPNFSHSTPQALTVYQSLNRLFDISISLTPFRLRVVWIIKSNLQVLLHRHINKFKAHDFTQKKTLDEDLSPLK